MEKPLTGVAEEPHGTEVVAYSNQRAPAIHPISRVRFFDDGLVQHFRYVRLAEAIRRHAA